MYFTEDDIYNISFDVNQIFKKILPSLGYNIRKSQIEMANEILEIVKHRKKCLIVEAGVGTGKSFGYLIPLLILYRESRIGFSIIISTGTISLQEQLIKDIKFLVDKLNVEINVVLAKGAKHFLCKDRMEKYNNHKKELPIWVKTWKKYSYYGDQAELKDAIPNINEVWENINVKNCKFTRCQYYHQCGFIKLREDMRKENSIIVTNHDQLIANAKQIENFRRPLFTDDTRIIVVDEAHNFEEKARNALTETWSRFKIESLLSTADNYLRKSDNYLETEKRKQKIEKLFEGLFKKLESHVNQIKSVNDKKGYDTQKCPLPMIEDSLIEEIKMELESYAVPLQLIESTSEEFDNIIDLIQDLIFFIDSIIYDDNKIFWIEASSQKDDITINSVPKEIDEIVYNYFFSDGKPPMILTSATISQPGEDNYDRYFYLLRNLGIDKLKCSQLELSDPKPSPFNYTENTLLYVSPNLPDPRENIDNYRIHSISEIVRLINVTEGRTMILFTSKSDMHYIYAHLKDLHLPWNILMQNEGSSQDKVKQMFIADEHSILLSTGTFWEGIDIPGPSLSNLIIFRLPFPVPDPILKYKESISLNGFSDVYIPEMLIKLRQGLGRLIRKETDKGIATILDSRISSAQNKEYRKIILDSIPFVNVTEDFQKVEQFAKYVLNFNSNT